MKSLCSRYVSVNYVINIISCFISVLFYFFILHIFYIDTLAVWYYSDLRSDLRKLIVQTHFTSTFHNCSFIQKSSWLLAFSINNSLCCPSPLAHDSAVCGQRSFPSLVTMYWMSATAVMWAPTSQNRTKASTSGRNNLIVSAYHLL